MVTNFWIGLKRPILTLAPLANVTDCAFRQMVAKYGKPSVLWTEFISADGLAHPRGREKLLIDLQFSSNERPIVAQFFGAQPENIRAAAALAVKLGFDGVDINMGCPDRAVERQGAGAALIKNPSLAQAIIRAAQEGSGGLPVSVKTRLGYQHNELDTWLPALLETEPMAVTIHARTRKQMSKVPADWGAIARAVAIRDQLGSKTLILGNGDLDDPRSARTKVAASGADGAMLGRAIFGRPWLFNDQFVPTPNERLRIAREHTALFQQMLSQVKNFEQMRKHFRLYITGWNGASELRRQLLETRTAEAALHLLDTYPQPII